MKIVTHYLHGSTFVQIDDGSKQWHSIRADGPNSSAEDAIRYHRADVLRELERLQSRLALYNSALSTLELEQESTQ